MLKYFGCRRKNTRQITLSISRNVFSPMRKLLHRIQLSRSLLPCLLSTLGKRGESGQWRAIESGFLPIQAAKSWTAPLGAQRGLIQMQRTCLIIDLVRLGTQWRFLVFALFFLDTLGTKWHVKKFTNSGLKRCFLNNEPPFDSSRKSPPSNAKRKLILKIIQNNILSSTPGLDMSFI